MTEILVISCLIINLIKYFIKKRRIGVFFSWRYHPDLNRGIKVLQTFALPLGDGTIKKWSGRRDSNSRHLPWQGNALPLSHSRISNFKSHIHLYAMPSDKVKHITTSHYSINITNVFCYVNRFLPLC